jgi:hypothetical protein
MTTKNKQPFYCECCDYSSSRRADYDRHLSSVKHEKTRKKCIEMRKNDKEQCENDKEMRKIDNIVPEKQILTNFCCDYCQFTCKIKKDAEKHRKSKQHVQNENKEEDFIEIVKQYTCVKCDKKYDKYISCWKHSNNCKGKIENIVIENIEENIQNKITSEPGQIICGESQLIVLETIVDKILENKNTALMEKMMERMVTVMEKMTETMTNVQPSLTQNNNYTNANISNNLNNHYSINMFLNEKCKDAVNITDWAKQLHVDYDHLYYTGENGFQKGLTNMLVENLNLCDVYNRPIHFTDIKRDSMYIRDADEWTKHENNEKLIEVLEISARQACIRLTDWMKEHEDVPDYHNLDSELGKQYLALMMSVIRPEAVRQKAYPKVMKELAKTAKLRKEDQI